MLQLVAYLGGIKFFATFNFYDKLKCIAAATNCI